MGRKADISAIHWVGTKRQIRLWRKILSPVWDTLHDTCGEGDGTHAGALA